jgi:hypothetical protein
MTFVRRRGASAELRKQLAWLGYVGLFVAVPVVPFIGYGVFTHGNVNEVAGVLFWTFILLPGCSSGCTPGWCCWLPRV